jgi:hypothetical protein
MTEKSKNPENEANPASTDAISDSENKAFKLKQAEGEIGGPAGLEPTRYGDWERKGIISDF